MAEVGAEENLGQKPTLEEFRQRKEVEARDYVFTEGPEEAWGYIYDNWPQTNDELRSVFGNDIAQKELLKYKSPKHLPKTPDESLHYVQEKFEYLESIQDDLSQLSEPTEEFFKFIRDLAPVVHFLDYLKKQEPSYQDSGDFFQNVISATKKCDDIINVYWFMNDFSQTKGEQNVPSFIYSYFAAIGLKDLDAAYKSFPPSDEEYQSIQDSLNVEINMIIHSWMENGIDFLNITDAPREFIGVLQDLKHLRIDVNSTISIPSGIIGSDLEKLISEDVFVDKSEIDERSRFLLLCNLRYLLQDAHDEYIDGEYDEKYGKNEN